MRAAVADWATSKPHVNATDKEGLLAAVAELDAWLAQREAAQAKVAPHEAPAFTSDDVAERAKAVDAAFQKLKRKPAPKPPKPATNASGAAANGTAAAAEEDGAAADRAGEATEEGSPLEGGDDAGPPETHDELR